MTNLDTASVSSTASLKQINDKVNGTEAALGPLVEMSLGEDPKGKPATVFTFDQDRNRPSLNSIRIVEAINGTTVAPSGFPNFVCEGLIYINGQPKKSGAYRKS